MRMKQTGWDCEEKIMQWGSSNLRIKSIKYQPNDGQVSRWQHEWIRHKAKYSTDAHTPLCSVCASWFSHATAEKYQGMNPEINEIYFYHLVQWAWNINQTDLWKKYYISCVFEFRSCYANMLHYIPVYLCLFLKNIVLEVKLLGHMLGVTTKLLSKIMYMFIFLLTVYWPSLCLMPLVAPSISF